MAIRVGSCGCEMRQLCKLLLLATDGLTVGWLFQFKEGAMKSLLFRLVASTVIYLLVALPVPVLAEAFREFSNEAGQTLKAVPVSVIGKQVLMQFEDGRELKITPSVFDAEGQAFLRQWCIMELARQDRLLDISVRRREVKSDEFEKDVPLVGGGVAKGALRVKEFDGFYEITVENIADFDLADLRLDYRIFSYLEAPGANSKDDVSYLRKSGTEKVSVASWQEATISTESVKLRETKLGKGIVWTDGGDQKSDSKMVGIWLRVYSGGRVVAEFALPSTLPQREDW